MSSRVGVGLNIVVIALVAIGLFRPAGPLGAAIARWDREREQRRTIKSSWSELSDGSRLDTGAGPIQLVEFVDYECRICRIQHTRMTQLLESGQISGIVVRHYPLAVYARSEGAARAAICAERQGRFRAMHHRLNTSSEWVSDANWIREAAAAEVEDLSAFEACLTSQATEARLTRDTAVARTIGVRATPVFAHFDEGIIRGMLADSVLTRLARNNR